MKSMMVLAAGLAMAASSSAQVLGIGAGLGVNADIGAVVGGTARAVSNTAANVRGAVFADIQGGVQAPPPAVRRELDSRVETESEPQRHGRRAPHVEHAGAGSERWTQDAAADSEPAPSRRGQAPVQARHATGATGRATGSVDAQAVSPRLDLGVRTRAEIGGGMLVR